MDLTLLYLLPLLIGIGLIFVAVRAHEQYWALGFLGWRKVYAGLGCYLVAGILYAIEFWALKSSGLVTLLRALEAGIVLFGVLGLVLVLAGSIERLRELSAERARLEDVRAGFDLFDSLREIVAQPYAFLEVLDYALKEMVRAAGVDSGGLWLYNPKKGDWVLTGWANLPEKLRQQTESVTGSGTGFDRLSAAHKARLFNSPDRIRVFFPEWEAEGYRAILGMPLTSGAVGSAGRQILGAMVLADKSQDRFDDDRARRLYAASDYVAAVIAEARMTRQLDAVRQQLDDAFKELERERQEARRQKEEAERHLAELQQKWEDETKSLQEAHASQVSELKAQAADELSEQRTTAREELHRLQTELEKRLAAETERAEQTHTRWTEACRTAEQLEKRLESERTNWEQRLDELHRQRKEESDEARRREDALVAKHSEVSAAYEKRITALEEELATQKHLVAERSAALQAAQELVKEREASLSSERKAREEASAHHQAALPALETRLTNLDAQLAAERQTVETLRNERNAARGKAAELDQALTKERQEYADARAALTAQLNEAREDAERERREREEQTASLSMRLGELNALVDAERHDHAARQAELTAQIDDLEARAASERTEHQQVQKRLSAQLEKLYESAEDENRTHAETVKQLNADLAAVQQGATAAQRASNREIKSLRLALDDRDRQISLWQESERQTLAEAVRAQRTASERIAKLETLLESERQSRETVEQEAGTLRTEWDGFEARREREIVEERLAHRRRLHAVESSFADVLRQSRELLGIQGGLERLVANLLLVRDQLPSVAQLYLVRREPSGEPRMLAWIDNDGRAYRGLPLPAWQFEIEAIPAEGTRQLTGPGEWESARLQQSADCRDAWEAHWGAERLPRWAVCWPWGGSAQESNGWITAFGMGDALVSEKQIEAAEMWVGYIAAALAPVTDAHLSHLPETHRDAESDSHAEQPSSIEPEPGEQTTMPAHTTEADDSTQNSEAQSSQDLHHAIVQWAADQTGDVFNLDLNAQPVISVDRSWLNRALERGRQSCRLAEQPKAEFTVSTSRENGCTVLRFVHAAPESNSGGDMTSVEDHELARPTQSPETPADQTEPPASARWLIRGGRTVGMELRFPSERPQAPAGEHDTAPDQTAEPLSAIVVSEDTPMGELLVDMLVALGGTATTTTDLAATESQASAIKANLVIVDTTMSDDVGWQIAREFIANHTGTPVLLIIGSDTVSIPNDAAGHWLLRIPFQIEELRECLEGMGVLGAHHSSVSDSE
jgi:hypothetical protein